MPNKYARANGNFDHPIWSLTSGGVAGSTTTPTIGDNAISNTFVVQITGDIACSNMTNTQLYGGTWGGGFRVLDVGGPVNIQSNLKILNQDNAASWPNYTTYAVLSVVNSGYTKIIGTIDPGISNNGNNCITINTSTGIVDISGSIIQTNVQGNQGGAGVLVVRVKELYILGDVWSENNNSGQTNRGSGLHIESTNSGSVSITGNITIGYMGIDNRNSYNIVNESNCKLYIKGNINASNRGSVYVVYLRTTSSSDLRVDGNVYGYSNNGIFSDSPRASIYVNGNVIATGAEAAISSTGNDNSVIVNGDVICDPLAIAVALRSSGSSGLLKVKGNAYGNIRASAISQTSTTGLVIMNGKIVNKGAPPAVYTPRLILNPTSSVDYINYIEESILYTPTYQYISDAFNTFSIPPVSSVRSGISYSSGSIGTCRMPEPSAVAYGVTYDTNESRVGLAVNLSNTIFNTLMSTVTAPNSIGLHLKKTATVDAVGHLITSFSN